MAFHPSFPFHPIAAAALLSAAAPAQAQSPPPDTTLAPVTVQEVGPTGAAGITGFGDTPLSRLPLQARVLGEAELKDRGSATVRELVRQDASVGDAYNAEGYWDQLSVRGYTLDNRSNYRRDGLPINAETSIPLANIAGIELLKGLSGMQAGVSAPGGLVNFVVKRPDGDIRSATVDISSRGSVGASVDLGSRFGTDRAFGLRFNAEAARLDPPLHDATGTRTVAALAGDWRLGTSSVLEAEIEASRRAQPSQPGFSLLGNQVPDARRIDPRVNLNDQPWSEPVVLAGQTGSLRWTQQLADGWTAKLHMASQRLKNDDRAAFPFGCSAEGNFDRYCSNGSFDLYDFRSDGERRDTTAVDASVNGQITTDMLRHSVTVGVLRSRFTARFNGQANNLVGTGTVDGLTVAPADPRPTLDNTDRRERSTELYLRDAVQVTDSVGLWLGLRHSRLQRDSITTSGTEASAYAQSFTTPWLAASLAVADKTLAYASWGQGIESDVVPARAGYANPGQPLAPLKSRQTEIGLKHGGDVLDAGIALFDITRPASSDLGPCDGSPDSCQHVNDGTARHRGLEANSSARLGPWVMGGSLMWLHARREDSADAAQNGQRPTNVPARSARLMARYQLAASIALDATVVAESDRRLLPDDDTLRIPGWARVDLGARFEQRLQPTTLTWRAGIDNLLDRRAWKEAPYEFGHVYLYPLAPRTWRMSVTAEL